MSSNPYIAHIVSRVQDDIEFLASQGALSQSDAHFIIGKLPATEASAPSMPMPASSFAPLRNTPTPFVKRSIPVPPPRGSVQLQAKAQWGYNENGQESGDLSFGAGEIIDILEETNEDWWKGRNSRGETGLFPANYVEKLTTPSIPISLPAIPGRMVAPIPQEKNGTSHMVPPPPPEVQIVPQAPQKKSKFGKLGNTMANSAAGGVGFGAGAAIGSGIVNAIF